MKVIIIGTGNIASFLVQKWKAHPAIEIIGIYGRNDEAAQALAQSQIPVFNALNSTYSTAADAIILAVNDNAIAGLAAQLQEAKAAIVHCSGAYTDTSQHTAGCLWPVYSIRKEQDYDKVDIPVAYYASSSQHQVLLQTLAQSMGTPFAITQDQKPWLHLCATVGNNFIHHLLSLTQSLMQEQQLPFHLLKPILIQTFEKYGHPNLQTLQTGPAVREDTQTMESHIALLQARPAFQQLYMCLSESIIQSKKSQ